MCDIVGSKCHAMVEVLPACCCRIGKVGQVRVGVPLEERKQAFQVPLERDLALGTDSHDVRRARVYPSHRAQRTIFNYNSRVTTSGTEVVHDSKALLLMLRTGTRRAGPLDLLHGDAHTALVQVLGEARRQAVLDPNVRRDGALLQHEQHLHQGRDAGGGLAVADVGLDGADVEGLLGAAAAGAGGICI